MKRLPFVLTAAPGADIAAAVAQAAAVAGRMGGENVSVWGIREFLFCYGEFHDRGFMTLPFCTIYGCSFLLLYSLIGPPRSSKNKAVYFLLCALIPTTLELITGWFFYHGFGLRLWSYESYRFQYRGYICLEYALLWGILIPPCMTHLVLPLKRRIFSMSAAHTAAVSLSLAAAAAADWSINFAKL